MYKEISDTEGASINISIHTFHSMGYTVIEG